MKYILTATVAAAVLTGCSDVSQTFADFDRPAGSRLDNGDFGNATMNNMMVQSGQQNYAVSLANRFNAEVEDTINFAFNSSALTEEAKATLRQQANWIKQFPEIRFRVFGHTDLVGSNSYNRRLGLRRAQSAVGYLISQGIDRNRLEAVSSLGETQPIVATQNREVRNRRTVTEVSGFVENHPMVLNGKYAEVIFRQYVVSGRPVSTISDTSTGESGGGL